MDKPVVAVRFPALVQLPKGVHYWCACGRSRRQPFCDWSHEGTGFAPMKIELLEKRNMTLCQCKQTQCPPHCDSSHSRLPKTPEQDTERPKPRPDRMEPPASGGAS